MISSGYADRGAILIFTESRIPGAWVIDLEPRGDERGFFARSWCREEFLAHGLNTELAQANVSFSRHRGTLRGMHYQRAPFAETKLVRCTRGSIFDVIVDLRADSSTRGEWFGVLLSAANYRMLYVPEGCAHGFVTLEDDSEVTYQVTAPYTPDAEGGLRYDDPALAIEWPEEVRVISDKDRSWPLLETGTGSVSERTVVREVGA